MQYENRPKIIHNKKVVIHPVDVRENYIRTMTGMEKNTRRSIGSNNDLTGKVSLTNLISKRRCVSANDTVLTRNSLTQNCNIIVGQKLCKNMCCMLIILT